MAWTNLPRNVSTLEASTVNAVYDNIQHLKTEMEQYGYNIGTMTPTNASYSTPIAQVYDTLMAIENDLTTLQSEDVQSIYYKAHHTIGNKFSVKEYQRWVDILNDLYEVVYNGKGKWSYLILRGTGERALDRNSDYIIMRGDEIGL